MRTNLITKAVTTSVLAATLLGAAAGSATAQEKAPPEIDPGKPMTDGDIEDLCKEQDGDLYYSDPKHAWAFEEAKCIKGSQVLFTCDSEAEDGLRLWHCEPGKPAPAGNHVQPSNDPLGTVSEPSPTTRHTRPATMSFTTFDR